MKCSFPSRQSESEMISYWVICLSIFSGVRCNTVTSPQIRIVDVAQKAYETRVFPHRLDYTDSYHQNIKESIQEGKSPKPYKSYVIYDDFPNKIFKEWEGNSPAFTKRMVPPVFQGVSADSKAALPEYYYYYRRPSLPPSNPTLSYQSVFSNVIKVFDNSLDNGQRFWLQSDRLALPSADGVLQSFQPPFQYEAIYPQQFQGQFFENQRLPENFPKVFIPNEEVYFSPSKNENSRPSDIFAPSKKFFGVLQHSDEAERSKLKNQAEAIQQYDTNSSKSNGRVMLCSLIRLNQKQFPENGGPCSRSEDNPIFSQEYPDYSKLPNDKIPLEHRRQHSHIKRIKRNDPRDSPKNKTKRSADFVGESDSGKFITFFNDYSNQDDNYGNSNYNSYSNRNSNRRNRNRGEYNEYDDDEYQNNEDSNSQGLSSYLSNGGRRYRNRQNNDEDNEDNDDNNNDNNNDNNRDNNNGENSDEEMEGQNSYGRSMNRRRNNNSRGRRNNYNNNNNNNNDEDDYRDNNRRNNYNNRQNNRRNNNNNNNNRRNNDYYNRNRNSYGGNNNNNNNNNNGYNSYGNGGYSSYGNRGYGNNDYGGNFGSSGYGNSNGYDSNSYGSYNSRGLGFGGYSGYGGYGGYSGYGNYGSGSGYGSFDRDDF